MVRSLKGGMGREAMMGPTTRNRARRVQGNPRWLLVMLAIALLALAGGVAWLMLNPGMQPPGGFPGPEAYPWTR